MLSFNPTPYNYFDAAKAWVLVLLVLGGIALLTFLATSVLTFGSRGPMVLLRQILEFFTDWFSTSPKRVLAVARLTVLEAIRRKVLYVFVVFGILYLFAGWFMTGVGSEADFALDPYVGFVLRSIRWPLVFVMLFLSCWGIPEDIRLRSLHTVVTKPIFKHEIILGRIIGFSTVGLGMLTIMSIVGYVWMWRGLPPAARVQLEGKYPIYGSMAFRSREGTITSKGINVGDENEFRSFIDGNTKATAIWDFYNPAWRQQIDDEELYVGGTIRPGDRFVLEYVEKGQPTQRISVIAKSSSSSEAASLIAEAWNAATEADLPKFAKVTATARGDRVRLTRKSPDALLAVDVSVVKNSKDDKDGPQFHGRGVLLESHFQAYRTWKGHIEQGVLCQLTLVNEYGVLTLPDQIPAGTLKLGKFSIPLQAGAVAVAGPALAAAIEKTNFGAKELPMLFEAKFESAASEPGADGGKSKAVAKIILRAPPNDVLPALKVDMTGFGYQYTRVEAPNKEFEIREFRRNEVFLRRGQTNRVYKPVDLFADLVNDGRLRIEARCRSGGQLLGAARPDLMVRLPSHTFLETYFKACLGIAMMIVLTVVLGVCSSTFVKGPVALLLTGTYGVLGTVVRSFLDWMFDPKNEFVGGGAFEGTYRVMYHLNPNTPIARSWGLNIAEALDLPLNRLLGALYKYVVPDFRLLIMDQYVAKLYDIPWQQAVLPCLVIVVGVSVPWLTLAHFSLKMRELEHK